MYQHIINQFDELVEAIRPYSAVSASKRVFKNRPVQSLTGLNTPNDCVLIALSYLEEGNENVEKALRWLSAATQDPQSASQLAVGIAYDLQAELIAIKCDEIIQSDITHRIVPARDFLRNKEANQMEKAFIAYYLQLTLNYANRAVQAYKNYVEECEAIESSADDSLLKTDAELRSKIQSRIQDLQKFNNIPTKIAEKEQFESLELLIDDLCINAKKPTPAGFEAVATEQLAQVIYVLIYATPVTLGLSILAIPFVGIAALFTRLYEGAAYAVKQSREQSFQILCDQVGDFISERLESLMLKKYPEKNTWLAELSTILSELEENCKPLQKPHQFDESMAALRVTIIGREGVQSLQKISQDKERYEEVTSYAHDATKVIREMFDFIKNHLLGESNVAGIYQYRGDCWVNSVRDQIHAEGIQIAGIVPKAKLLADKIKKEHSEAVELEKRITSDLDELNKQTVSDYASNGIIKKDFLNAKEKTRRVIENIRIAISNFEYHQGLRLGMNNIDFSMTRLIGFFDGTITGPSTPKKTTTTLWQSSKYGDLFDDELKNLADITPDMIKYREHILTDEAVIGKYNELIEHYDKYKEIQEAKKTIREERFAGNALS